MKLIAESLDEFIKLKGLFEFKRTGDPKTSMGIGIETVIRNWMRTNTSYNVDKKPAAYHWRKPPTVYSLLWLCVRLHKPEWVESLLRMGYDPNENDGAALRWACGLGYSDIVGMLLDAGADPDADGPNGPDDAYEWARRKGHDNIVRMLDLSKRGYTFMDKDPHDDLPEDDINITDEE